MSNQQVGTERAIKRSLSPALCEAGDAVAAAGALCAGATCAAAGLAGWFHAAVTTGARLAGICILMPAPAPAACTHASARG